MNKTQNEYIVELHELAQSPEPHERDFAYYAMASWDWEQISHAKAVWKLLEMNNNLTGSEH